MPENPLRQFWETWKRFGRKAGDVQARFFLSVFYFAVLAPFALIVRWAADPLAIKPGSARGWQRRPDPAQRNPLDGARRQF